MLPGWFLLSAFSGESETAMISPTLGDYYVLHMYYLVAMPRFVYLSTGTIPLLLLLLLIANQDNLAVVTLYKTFPAMLCHSLR